MTIHEGDSSWAATPDLLPQSPITILGRRGTPLHTALQQPTPVRRFGTILPFHTVPTSPPCVTDPPSTEPLPHQATYGSSPGTAPSRTQSGHQSLSQSSKHPLRNPSLVPPAPSTLPTGKNVDEQHLAPPWLRSIQEINHDARRYSIDARGRPLSASRVMQATPSPRDSQRRSTSTVSMDHPPSRQSWIDPQAASPGNQPQTSHR